MIDGVMIDDLTYQLLISVDSRHESRKNDFLFMLLTYLKADTHCRADGVSAFCSTMPAFSNWSL